MYLTLFREDFKDENTFKNILQQFISEDTETTLGFSIYISKYRHFSILDVIGDKIESEDK